MGEIPDSVWNQTFRSIIPVRDKLQILAWIPAVCCIAGLLDSQNSDLNLWIRLVIIVSERNFRYRFGLDSERPTGFHTRLKPLPKNVKSGYSNTAPSPQYSATTITSVSRPAVCFSRHIASSVLYCQRRLRALYPCQISRLYRFRDCLHPLRCCGAPILTRWKNRGMARRWLICGQSWSEPELVFLTFYFHTWKRWCGAIAVCQNQYSSGS